MITDQTFVSAGAEKPNTAGRRFVRGMLTASIAAALTVPSLAAWGIEGPRETPASGNILKTISLPPIPYLDTMPWLNWNTGANSLKVDTLLSPTLDPSGIRLRPDERGSEMPAVS